MMPMEQTGYNDVTQLLVAWTNGDETALENLLPLIYDELHRLARRYMRREAPGQTLQTTALVHEAYLRLINQKHVNWQNRTHFFAASAQSMRHILVDMARGRNRQRRGGGAPHFSLDEAFDSLDEAFDEVAGSVRPPSNRMVFSLERASEIVALDDALTALAKLDERKSRIVELRFFGGLSTRETAEILKISEPTVEREWRRAKAWLSCELKRRLA